MEMTWLEDFLTLVECGNFSRAAERRNITQPTFSRRVRALEAWVGTPLFDRDTHRVVVTAAGERFRSVAEETLRRLYVGREDAKEAAQELAETLKFASTHALSLTFFPEWLRSVEECAPLEAPVRLVADTMAACERIMLQGGAQFLLCHHHYAAASVLDQKQFRSLPLRKDVLIPISSPDRDDPTKPRFQLPGSAADPLPLLAYSAESGMGRIVAAAQAIGGMPASLFTSFTSHVALVLATMAHEGRGIVWSPLSLVANDIAAGRLVPAGGESWNIQIEIRLFRPRSRQSPAAERFWSHISTQNNLSE